MVFGDGSVNDKLEGSDPRAECSVAAPGRDQLSPGQLRGLPVGAGIVPADGLHFTAYELSDDGANVPGLNQQRAPADKVRGFHDLVKLLGVIRQAIPHRNAPGINQGADVVAEEAYPLAGGFQAHGGLYRGLRRPLHFGR